MNCDVKKCVVHRCVDRVAALWCTKMPHPVTEDLNLSFSILACFPPVLKNISLVDYMGRLILPCLPIGPAPAVYKNPCADLRNPDFYTQSGAENGKRAAPRQHWWCIKSVSQLRGNYLSCELWALYQATLARCALPTPVLRKMEG